MRKNMTSWFSKPVAPAVKPVTNDGAAVPAPNPVGNGWDLVNQPAKPAPVVAPTPVPNPVGNGWDQVNQPVIDRGSMGQVPTPVPNPVGNGFGQVNQKPQFSRTSFWNQIQQLARPSVTTAPPQAQMQQQQANAARARAAFLAGFGNVRQMPDAVSNGLRYGPARMY